MTDKAPVIEGKNELEQTPAEKQETQEVLEIAAHMDSDVVRPVDEIQEYRDIERDKPQEEIIEHAKENVKKYVSEARKASLEKARKAKAEIARYRKLQGHEAAQGTPAPDILTHVVEKLNKQFEEVNTKLESLKTIYAHQAPLQPQQIVNSSKPVPVEYPAQPNDMIQVAKKEKPQYEMHTSGRQQQERERSSSPKRQKYESKDPYVKEEKRYNEKFKSALEHFRFNTEDVTARVKNNEQSMGSHHNNSKELYW